jgi:hypothetical protein
MGISAAAPASAALLQGGIAGASVFGMLEIGRRCKRRRVQGSDSDATESVENKQGLETKVCHLEKQVQHLTTAVKNSNERCRTMPDWNVVGPMLSQMKELESELSRKPSLDEVPTHEQLSKLTIEVKQKANGAEVPTLQQFSDLAANFDQKPNRNEVPTLEQVVGLSQKIEEIPGSEQMVKRDEVVSLEQFQETLTLINQKPNFDQVPSLAQVRQLSQSVATMSEDNAIKLSELSEGIKSKPDFDQLPTLAEVQKLTADMQECVVPGLLQVEELMSAWARLGQPLAPPNLFSESNKDDGPVDVDEAVITTTGHLSLPHLDQPIVV